MFESSQGEMASKRAFKDIREGINKNKRWTRFGVEEAKYEVWGEVVGGKNGMVGTREKKG